jgi:hypothetical protein
MYSVMAILVRFLPFVSVIAHIIEETCMESKDAKAKASVEVMAYYNMVLTEAISIKRLLSALDRGFQS